MLRRILLHRTTEYDAEPLISQSEQARALFKTGQRTVRTSDSCPEPLFATFFDLLNSRPTALNPDTAPALLGLIRYWGCLECESELERQLLHSQDPNAILQFLAAAPDSFPALIRHITSHYDVFESNRHLVGLPISVLNRILGVPDANPASPEAIQLVTDLTSGAGDDESEQELRNLADQVATVKARIQEADSDGRGAVQQQKVFDAKITGIQTELDKKRAAITKAQAELDAVDADCARLRREIEEINDETEKIASRKAEIEAETSNVRDHLT
jgi:hypothetical protein